MGQDPGSLVYQAEDLQACYVGNKNPANFKEGSNTIELRSGKITLEGWTGEQACYVDS